VLLVSYSALSLSCDQRLNGHLGSREVQSNRSRTAGGQPGGRPCGPLLTGKERLDHPEDWHVPSPAQSSIVSVPLTPPTDYVTMAVSSIGETDTTRGRLWNSLPARLTIREPPTGHREVRAQASRREHQQCTRRSIRKGQRLCPGPVTIIAFSVKSKYQIAVLVEIQKQLLVHQSPRVLGSSESWVTKHVLHTRSATRSR